MEPSAASKMRSRFFSVSPMYFDDDRREVDAEELEAELGGEHLRRPSSCRCRTRRRTGPSGPGCARRSSRSPTRRARGRGGAGRREIECSSSRWRSGTHEVLPAVAAASSRAASSPSRDEEAWRAPRSRSAGSGRRGAAGGARRGARPRRPRRSASSRAGTWRRRRRCRSAPVSVDHACSALGEVAASGPRRAARCARRARARRCAWARAGSAARGAARSRAAAARARPARCRSRPSKPHSWRPSSAQHSGGSAMTSRLSTARARRTARSGRSAASASSASASGARDHERQRRVGARAARRSVLDRLLAPGVRAPGLGWRRSRPPLRRVVQAPAEQERGEPVGDLERALGRAASVRVAREA